MTTTPAPSVDSHADDDLPLSVRPEPADSVAEPITPPSRSAPPVQSVARKAAFILKVIVGLIISILLGMVIFMWMLLRQQQIQLTTLEAALRSGQLQSLPDRLQQLEDKQQQFLPGSQAEKWRQTQAQQNSELKAQLAVLIADTKKTQSSAASAIAAQNGLERQIETLRKALDTQVLRIDTLSDRKAPAASLVGAKKPSKLRRLTPPFTLVSIERRGGQDYVVTLPAGGSWAQLRMLSPGESLSGWTLAHAGYGEATFRVNGKLTILKVE